MNARGVANLNAIMLQHADRELYCSGQRDRVLIADQEVFAADLPDRLLEFKRGKRQGVEGDEPNGKPT
jgi:hypothetical protein